MATNNKNESNSGDSSGIRLKVSGLGHNVEFETSSSSTIEEIKAIVAAQVEVPPPYLLLLCRGKKLLELSATLEQLKIADRTKLMLLHAPEWHRDKAGVKTIQAVHRELNNLEAAVNDGTVEMVEVEERVTRTCIRLDNIEINGSETLRQLRREALRRGENVSKQCDRAGTE